MSAATTARAVAIIQARMGSTRLPGKSLADLGGTPVVDWVHRRVAAAGGIDAVIVATTDLANDDALADHLADQDVTVVRGDADDVLARFGLALTTTDAEFIVRITADCPFVQPVLIDRALGMIGDADYVPSGHDGHMPRGFDLEVIRRTALETALAEAIADDEREHVTPFIARRPERFPTVPFVAPQWAQRGDLRLTVDEQVDLDVVRAIVEGMGVTPDSLTGPDLMAFCDAHPEITALNAKVDHRTVR